MGREEVYTRFSLANFRERDHLEDPGVDGRILKHEELFKINVSVEN
jgi:hypothetical protein